MAKLFRSRTQPAPAAPPAPPTLEERLGYATEEVEAGVSLARSATAVLEGASGQLRDLSREAQVEAARLAGIAQRALVEAETASRSADAVKVVVEGH